MNCRWEWYFENAAQRFRAQIVVQMLVYVVQRVVFKCLLHRLFLRGDTSQALPDVVALD